MFRPGGVQTCMSLQAIEDFFAMEKIQFPTADQNSNQSSCESTQPASNSSVLHLKGKKFTMKINNGSGFLLLLLQLKYASAFPILPSGRVAATTVALQSEPERTRDVSVGSGTIPSASIPGALSNGAVPEKPQNLFVAASPILVQGNSLRTWSFPNSNVKRVQLLIKTQGRPLHTNIEIWQGPDNTPQKMGVYIEDGNMRPFCCVAETPHGQNAVAVYNTGSLEFPLLASVDAIDNSMPMSANLQDKAGRTIQGGALHTYPFPHNVESIAVLLTTSGRPLEARIELLSGPNNNKQVMEIECEDGEERPFYVVIASPGSGNVIRIVNLAPMEFPLTAVVEPFEIDMSYL